MWRPRQRSQTNCGKCTDRDCGNLTRRAKPGLAKASSKLLMSSRTQLWRDIAGSGIFKSVRNLTVRRFYNSRLGFESVGYPGMGQPDGHRDFDQPPSESGDQHKGMEVEAALPEGEGKKEVAASCGQCHRLDVVTSQRKTRAEWQQTVSKMITQYHASLEPKVADKIVAYLSQNLGSH